MTLKDMMKSDADFMAAEVGTAAVYKITRSVDPPVPLDVIIQYDALQRRDSGRSTAGPIEVLVPRSKVSAIDVESPDMIQIPPRGGGDPVWMPVTALLSGGDDGFWHIAVGR